MWIKSSNSDDLTLVLEDPWDDRSLTRQEIHVSIRFARNGTIHWRYIHHQPYQRAAATIPWEAGRPNRWFRINRGLFQQIHARILDELTALLIVLEPEDKPEGLLDPPAGFDRRAVVSALLASVTTRMLEPSSANVSHNRDVPLGILESVIAIRAASGLDRRGFAKAIMANLKTVEHLETGKSSAAPSTLRQIAIMGRRYMQWKAADFLDTHALMADSKINTKGGHR